MKTIDAFTLTPKQQRFCDEYLIDMNATRAALRAGYTQATAMNGQLMEMPKIQAYLKKRTAEAAQKLQVSHETLLGELMKVAFANMGDYFGDDGKIKAMNDILDDKKSAIWSLKVSEGKYGTTVQLRLHNKLAALEKIAKHIKFYEVEQKKPVEEAVYVDKEDLNEDDRFEDDSIDALDKDLYEKKVKLETLQRELYLKERDLKQREADLATREEGVRAAIA
ncbi:terminase small subunit, partial [uncultured Mucilaginibacter sp.]